MSAFGGKGDMSFGALHVFARTQKRTFLWDALGRGDLNFQLVCAPSVNLSLARFLTTDVLNGFPFQKRRFAVRRQDGADHRMFSIFNGVWKGTCCRDATAP
jgi:hypothetical protein